MLIALRDTKCPYPSKPVYLLKNLRHLHPHVLDVQGSARHIPVSSAHKNLDLNQVAFALPL